MFRDVDGGCWQDRSATLLTYNGLDRDENHYCPVSSPVCVGQESSEERREEAAAEPSGHVRGSVDIAFVKHAREIGDQVLLYPREGQAFTDFGT